MPTASSFDVVFSALDRSACAKLEDHWGVHVELIHIDDCPSWVEAGNRLREALAALGFDEVGVGYRLVSTTEEAARIHFAGSPTILVDGEDLFPTGAQTSDLACRVYVTPAGLAGLPTTGQIIDAIGSHGR